MLFLVSDHPSMRDLNRHVTLLDRCYIACGGEPEFCLVRMQFCNRSSIFWNNVNAGINVCML